MILAMPVLTCFDCQLPDGPYRVFPITDTDPKECPYCHGSNVEVRKGLTGIEHSYDAKGRRFYPWSKDKRSPSCPKTQTNSRPACRGRFG